MNIIKAIKTHRSNQIEVARKALEAEHFSKLAIIIALHDDDRINYKEYRYRANRLQAIYS